jgi:hypothetical protein
VLTPHGVASAEYLVIPYPAFTDLPLHLLFDAGESVVANFAYLRRFVLYPEEHGVLALDVVLPYSSIS